MKILIAVPCMEDVPVEYVNSLLALKKPEGTQVSHLSCCLVYVAREMLAQHAIKGDFDYVMFIDSDMMFPSDTLNRLLKDDKDVVSALAFMRKPPYSPCIYDKVKIGDSIEPFKEYPKDKLVEVEGCGLACCLIKAKVLKDIYKKGQAFNPIGAIGEDLSFCLRARECGYKIYADTSIKIGHIGRKVYGEEEFRTWNEC